VNVTKQSLTPKALADLFRSHSRLEGSLAANLEGWLRETDTVPRYLDLIPAPLAGESRLLEIGCYQPTVGYYFALGWRDVIGIFKDDGEGTAITEYAGDAGERVRLVMADVETERLPVADGWADAVVMMQVWEHFALDPMNVLWEINRVLKPGGRFILSTPNGACWLYAMRIARGTAAWGGMEFTGFSTNRHNRLYDTAEMTVILQQAGFEVTESTSRAYGRQTTGLQQRVFRWGLSLIDAVATLVSGRRRDRELTLVARAVKKGPPVERFPSSLYLSDADWPGIAAERDRVMAARASRDSGGH
jgi:SAM-dependent methyltransferase